MSGRGMRGAGLSEGRAPSAVGAQNGANQLGYSPANTSQSGAVAFRASRSADARRLGFAASALARTLVVAILSVTLLQPAFAVFGGAGDASPAPGTSSLRHFESWPALDRSLKASYLLWKTVVLYRRGVVFPPIADNLLNAVRLPAGGTGTGAKRRRRRTRRRSSATRSMESRRRSASRASDIRTPQISLHPFLQGLQSETHTSDVYWQMPARSAVLSQDENRSCPRLFDGGGPLRTRPIKLKAFRALVATNPRHGTVPIPPFGP
jgi:hypothetical protein